MGGYILKYVRGVDTIEKVILKGTKEQNEEAISSIMLIEGVQYINGPKKDYISPMSIKIGLSKDYLEKLQFILATLPFEFIYREKEYKSPAEIDFIDVEKYVEESNHLQSKTINADLEKGEVTLYYRKGKLQDSYKDKIFAAETKDSISFHAYVKPSGDSNEQKPQEIVITIAKNLIGIKKYGEIEYEQHSSSEYKVSEIKKENQELLLFLGYDNYRKKTWIFGVGEDLLNQVSKTYRGISVVESEEDLKSIVGEYYQDFISLFETSFNECGLFVVPKDEYYQRQAENKKIKMAKRERSISEIENDIKQETINRNKQILAELVAQADCIPGLSDTLPGLVVEFCKERESFYEDDPIASFMLSMLRAFISDPGSLDPKQKDKYVPMSILYNLYPPAIREYTHFWYKDTNNMYKDMNYNPAYDKLGIVIQLYSIFQRVLLGEIDLTSQAMLEAFKELDVVNAYKKEKEMIDNIINTLIYYGEKLSAVESLSERYGIITEMESKIYYPESAKRTLEVKIHFDHIATTSHRHDEICERILEEQLAKVEKEKHNSQ